MKQNAIGSFEKIVMVGNDRPAVYKEWKKPKGLQVKEGE